MGFQVFLRLPLIILIIVIKGVVVAKVPAAGQECRMTRCSHHGPIIRFPFWIKEKQPERCGYPGFQVFCDRGKPLLHLQYIANTSLPETLIFLSKNVSIYTINYTSQEIELQVLNGSQFTSNLKLFSTSTPLPSVPHFKISYDPYYYMPNTTFVSCSKRIKAYIPDKLTSVGGKTFPVYCPDDSRFPGDKSISSCTKIFSSSLPASFQSPGFWNHWKGSHGIDLSLSWLTPDCSKCEAKGEYCMMKSSTTGNIKAASNTTICLPKDKGNMMEKNSNVSDGLQSLKPTRYSYADIKKITRNFSDKLGQGGCGSVYKGQITKEIIVAVKVLNSNPKASGEDFINEVGTIGRIYHVNVVRLVGYCADGCSRALIYEYQPNNSLEKFTYSGKMQLNNFLGWKKMQEIALGIAKGIEYLHQGCAEQILHFDIKPHNILLDQNFSPKISDFGLAKLCSKDRSIVSMTMARGTIGYIAPEVFSRNFGKVSSKSDVYSFGMLLLEMVGARNNNAEENTSETYFPEWVFHRLEDGGEVAIQIEKEEDSDIVRKLTIVGLWCIGWHPVDRPSMRHVIQMLESEECLKMPPNPFRSSNVRSFINDLGVISESE